MRLAGQAVERDLDRKHGRIGCCFAQQIDEWIHALIGVGHQLVVLDDLLHDRTILIDARRPGRGERLIGELSSDLGVDKIGKAPGVAHIKRHVGNEHLISVDIQTREQEFLRYRRERGVGLKANRGKASTLLQDALHVLAVVIIDLVDISIRIDVGIACDADNARALRAVHGEHFIDDELQGVFEQDELRAFTGQKDEAFRLTGKGDQAEVHIFGTHVLRLLLGLCFFVF